MGGDSLPSGCPPSSPTAGTARTAWCITATAASAACRASWTTTAYTCTSSSLRREVGGAGGGTRRPPTCRRLPHWFRAGKDRTLRRRPDRLHLTGGRLALAGPRHRQRGLQGTHRMAPGQVRRHRDRRHSSRQPRQFRRCLASASPPPTSRAATKYGGGRDEHGWVRGTAIRGRRSAARQLSVRAYASRRGDRLRRLGRVALGTGRSGVRDPLERPPADPARHA